MREAELECAPCAPTAVVVLLPSMQPELVGSESPRPDTTVNERLDLGAHEAAGFEPVPALNLLPQHRADEGGLAVGPEGPLARVALPTAALQAARDDERRRRSSDHRRAQEPGSGEVLAFAQADENDREFNLAEA